MPIVEREPLTQLAHEIFARHGAPAEVARTVAQSLVLANLKGYDSHGVIRIPEYVAWIAKGWIVPGAAMEVVADRGSILAIDGHFGFGQVVGRRATELAIAKAKETGVCVLTIRRSAHLGRVGEFSEMAAEAGLVSFSWTNTHGGGVLVAPHGGRERRLSANPLAAGASLPDGRMLLMDFATSVIADGKVKVARARGERLPPGCVVNARGEPTTDPAEYDADPPGALLPFGGHKGYALSLFAEVLAGALSGAGCSTTGVDRIANGMLALFLDPSAFCGEPFFADQLGALATHVTSSAPMEGFNEVLLPGEPDARTFAERSQHGIPIDDTTWGRIVAVARRRNTPLPHP
jgi:uncharacterized oxidoreductase